MRRIGADFVPVQEEHEARLESRLSLEEWAKMDLMEKALLIAVRRNRLAIRNINGDVEIDKAEREAKRARSKGKH